jgi:hypothetical protein
VAVTGEASQGRDPGPPQVTAQGQGGKSWNLHMGPTALPSTGSEGRITVKDVTEAANQA